jgi:hypothetical protein
MKGFAVSVILDMTPSMPALRFLKKPDVSGFTVQISSTESSTGSVILADVSEARRAKAFVPILMSAAKRVRP